MVEDELLSIAEAISDLQQNFVTTRDAKFLRSEEQAEFKRLVVEAKSIMDSTLGRANDFSLNLMHTINFGSGGFISGPSFACVGEAAALIRGSVNHIRRQPIRRDSAQRSSILKQSYVDSSRLAAIQAVQSSKWDFARLARLCGELNVAHENECHMTVAMLVRGIADHVPPIFGCRTFTEVASNYSGSRSFKNSMRNLDQSLRSIADAHLHTHIRSKESVPSAVQVNFSQDLDVLLAETVRLAEAKS